MFFTILALLFSTLAAPAQPIGAGSIGGACLADQSCGQGVCDQNLDLCIACGMPGEAACTEADGQFSCHLPSRGYAPVPTTNGQQMLCGNPASDDCGQVGALACRRDGAPYCYYGTLAGAYCAACGDYGQACCADTVYECDYGSCQAGTCLPDPNTGGSQITAAIADCRFKDAQSLLAAAPAPAAQAALTAAMAREARVATLFSAAQDLSRQARLSYLDEDHGNAALAFREAMARLLRASALTQCVSSLLALDESLEIAARGLDQSQTEGALDTARQALGLCLFDLAEESLVSLVSSPERAALLQRVAERRATEARALTQYQAAQALNTTGQTQLANSQFTQALASFNAAHAGFMQVRQLTHCEDTRSQIDNALAIVGRNILRADEGPQEVAPAAALQASAPHICLDPAIPAPHYVVGYQRYFGGGSTSWEMKDAYICGFYGAFSTLSPEALVAYSCDREGDQYINCRETMRTPVDSWDVVPDGVKVTYRHNGGEYWIVIHEH